MKSHKREQRGKILTHVTQIGEIEPTWATKGTLKIEWQEKAKSLAKKYSDPNCMKCNGSGYRGFTYQKLLVPCDCIGEKHSEMIVEWIKLTKGNKIFE